MLEDTDVVTLCCAASVSADGSVCFGKSGGNYCFLVEVQLGGSVRYAVCITESLDYVIEYPQSY